MRHQVNRRHQQQPRYSARATPQLAVRRYLPCLRQGISDTDSDDISRSMMADDVAEHEHQMQCDTCMFSLIQRPSLTAVDIEMTSSAHMSNDTCTTPILTDTSQLIASPCRDSSLSSSLLLHSALPLFSDHFRLPLFTGRRRWHAMFGCFDEPREQSIDDTDALAHADDDILTDSNLVSLFDSSNAITSDCHEPSPCVSSAFQYGSGINNDDAVELRRSLCVPDLGHHQPTELLSIFEPVLPANNETIFTNAEPCFLPEGSVAGLTRHENMITCITRDLEVQGPCISTDNSRTHCETCLPEDDANAAAVADDNGSTLHRHRERRHSAPSSTCSSTTGSQSGESSSHNSWYFYDRRLQPGGMLASAYSHTHIRRSLSAIVFPPAYDDIVALESTNVMMAASELDGIGERPPLAAATAAAAACVIGRADELFEMPPPYVLLDEMSPYSSPHEFVHGTSFLDASLLVTPEEPPTYAEAVRETACPQGWINEEDSASVCHQRTQVESRAGSNYTSTAVEIVCSLPVVEHVLPAHCLPSPGMFGGRPAVRWNRNMRVERWTSSANWITS